MKLEDQIIVFSEEIDILDRLDKISDLVVGNIAPEDISADEIGSLPELFAYIDNNKFDEKYLKEALYHIEKLEASVVDMKEKVTQWSKMVHKYNENM